MLEAKFIVNNVDVIKKDLKKRGDKEKPAWVDEFADLFTKSKKLKEKIDGIRHSRNVITQEINQLRKAGKDFKPKVQEAKEIPEKIAKEEKKLEKMAERMKFIQMRIPNILHESVPVGKDDTENEEVSTWGKAEHKKDLITHSELLEQLDGAEFERATKVSGAGFYYLKGDIARLEQALIQFAIDELNDFTLIQTPLMMRREAYEGVTDLKDFEDVMYKIEDDDSYLIATSEHPIAAMFKDETIPVHKLPIKLLGISTCFRREIGSHGVDTRGLYRVHQFNKVEQFVFCKPEDSWKFFDDLIKNAEDLYKKLKIPYHVVNICTGDIGIIAAKKFDIEAWFPRQNAYKEVVSCSNCTGYQATRLNIKYKDGEEKQFVHTLNSTAIATSRVLVAILENYQNKDGSVTVPDVLQKYLGKKKISVLS